MHVNVTLSTVPILKPLATTPMWKKGDRISGNKDAPV